MVATAFGWANEVVSATLSTGSSEVNLGISNWQNDQGAPVLGWQTLAGDVTETAAWALIDSGDSTTLWQAFGLFRTNLTQQATVRWQVGDTLTSGQITSPTLDTGTVNAGVAVGYGQSLVIQPTTAGRYCQVSIADAGNPDGFINIPLAFAGPLFLPASGVTYASSVGRTDNTAETLTRGGQEYPVLNWTKRYWDLAMDGIRVGELWTRIGELDRAARAGGNILFIPDIASTNIGYEPVFGRLKVTAPIGFPYGAADRRSWRATVSERL